MSQMSKNEESAVKMIKDKDGNDMYDFRSPQEDTTTPVVATTGMPMKQMSINAMAGMTTPLPIMQSALGHPISMPTASMGAQMPPVAQMSAKTLQPWSQQQAQAMQMAPSAAFAQMQQYQPYQQYPGAYMAGPMTVPLAVQMPQAAPVSGDLGVLAKGLQAVQTSVGMLLDEAGAIYRGNPPSEATKSNVASLLAHAVPHPVSHSGLNSSTSEDGILKRLSALEKANKELVTHIKGLEVKERQSEETNVKLRNQVVNLKKHAVFLHKGAHKHKQDQDSSDAESETTTEIITTTTEMPTTTAKSPEKAEDSDESEGDDN